MHTSIINYLSNQYMHSFSPYAERFSLFGFGCHKYLLTPESYSTKKQTVDTVCFVGYSRYNVVAYLSAAANNGIIIVNTNIPEITAAMIFFVFLLYIYTPLFHERL